MPLSKIRSRAQTSLRKLAGAVESAAVPLLPPVVRSHPKNASRPSPRRFREVEEEERRAALLVRMQALSTEELAQLLQTRE